MLYFPRFYKQFILILWFIWRSLLDFPNPLKLFLIIPFKVYLFLKFSFFLLNRIDLFNNILNQITRQAGFSSSHLNLRILNLSFLTLIKRCNYNTRPRSFSLSCVPILALRLLRESLSFCCASLRPQLRSLLRSRLYFFTFFVIS